MKHAEAKVSFGDFQTPIDLARQCCQIASEHCGDVGTVIEPTCGEGTFVHAALDAFPQANLLGFEINEKYRRKARRGVGEIDKDRVSIRKQDFFQADWQSIRDQAVGNVLFLGNPPWVTNSQLGVLGSVNVPSKKNVESIRGIEAMTGRSNFDLSESILQTLLEAMRPDQDHLAMLVKTATARKILRMQWGGGANFHHASLRRIDAKEQFGVSVDACWLMLSPGSKITAKTQVCFQSDCIEKQPVSSALAWYDGHLVSDAKLAKATASLHRPQSTPWRSGVKHDVSRVLELRIVEGRLQRQDGTDVDVEPDLVYPLAKGADVANSRTDCPNRRILVTQHRMNESTDDLQERLPKSYRYLYENRDAFAARKSSIYRKRDPFALFGIGDYTFAPWKIAICGLYKKLQFTLLAPIDGKPVLVDDTCYQLGFRKRADAKKVLRMLVSDEATDFFRSRIFWDAKRPITAELLRSLDLTKLASQLKVSAPKWNI
jgi:hypothetical protein